MPGTLLWTWRCGGGRRQRDCDGKREPAQRGLWQYRLDLEYQGERAGKWYAVQQLVPVVDHQPSQFVVVAVYTFYCLMRGDRNAD
jgi:hypothetical protein